MDIKSVQPVDVHSTLKSGQEIAFLDVREHGVHAQGHPLFAVPVPASRFELNIERLVPRKSVPVVLMGQDDKDPIALRAAEKMVALGYHDVAILEGGATGWHTAGFELFSGVNVPSKAFGEVVEETCGTPHISADDLSRRLQAAEDIIILDSRPFAEYNRMAIPGGIDMPGAELAHRVYETVPDESTTIVVNCAGRTRSIIGAQSLINAGVKNPVVALENGTMGWYLAGFKPENGADRIAPAPNKISHQKSLKAAQKLTRDLGIEVITPDKLRDFQSLPDRTVFLLDVRTAEEYETGHLEGAQHAPGGQLVQATDEYVGIKGAILVLYDDYHTRSHMTASWLKQMGWQDVYVLDEAGDLPQVAGPATLVSVPEFEQLSAMELQAVLFSGQPIAVIDLSPSLSYRRGHIPEACWAIRSRLENAVRFLPPVGMIILTADDVRVAHLAAPELLTAHPHLIVRVLEGGHDAWTAAGFEMEAGDGQMLSELDDQWYKPYDNKDRIRERMQEYLDWETALIPQINRDGTTKFQVYKPE